MFLWSSKHLRAAHVVVQQSMLCDQSVRSWHQGHVCNPSLTHKKTMRIIVKFKHTVCESSLLTTTEVCRPSFTNQWLFITCREETYCLGEKSQMTLNKSWHFVLYWKVWLLWIQLDCTLMGHLTISPNRNKYYIENTEPNKFNFKKAIPLSFCTSMMDWYMWKK